MCPYLIFLPPQAVKGPWEDYIGGWRRGRGARYMLNSAELLQPLSLFLHFCSSQGERHVGVRHSFLEVDVSTGGSWINGFLSRNRRRRQLHAIDVELTTYFYFFDLLPWSPPFKVLIKPMHDIEDMASLEAGRFYKNQINCRKSGLFYISNSCRARGGSVDEGASCQT